MSDAPHQPPPHRDLLPSATRVTIPVAWGEMDAFGHVNNIVYFRYLESARIDFLRCIGWAPHTPSSDSPIGVILHSVRCRFRAPVKFPDTLTVTSRILSIEDDRFTLAHQVWSQALSRIAAEGEGTIVAFDYPRGQKAVIPAHFRDKLRRMPLG